MEVRVERVDDLPLLVYHMKRMGVDAVLDEQIRPHGNWKGVSLGCVGLVWLTYLLSTGDHRMCALEEWVGEVQETLGYLLGQEIRREEFSDDRLGRFLGYLGDDAAWERVEAALGERLIRIYDLERERVRVDMTTLSVYGKVTPEGLVQFGYSKEGRLDVPQVKVALAVLDPLGLPLATEVVAGNRADDPLYLPIIERVREVVGGGKMYVGDCKMEGKRVRGALQEAGDIYLCPASRKLVTRERLKQYVERGKIERWRRELPGGQELEAEGFVVYEEMRVRKEDGGEVRWVEERWVLRSPSRYERAVEGLESRLEKAKDALWGLNVRKRGKKRFRRREDLEERVEGVLRRYEVEGLVEVEYRKKVERRQVRRYGSRPSREVEEVEWEIGAVRVKEEAVEEEKRLLGWRVYLTNARAQGKELGGGEVMEAYRSQFVVEQQFSQFKDRTLGIRPLYVQKDEHRRGLIRLFSLALRVLTLLAYEVRRRLKEKGEEIYGLYEGNPKRGTARPTARRLLRAFRGVNLAIVRVGEGVHRHLTPLSETQKHILSLLNFPETIYTGLVGQFPEPP